MYQRPKIGEKEEDLLKLQREFFKQKEEKDFKLAAKLIKAENKGDDGDAEETGVDDDVQFKLSNTFEDIPKNVTIGDIKVKTEDGRKVSLFKCSRDGFPQAKRRDSNTEPGKGSIFSRQMKKLKSENGNEEMEIDMPSTSSASSMEIIEHSQELLEQKFDIEPSTSLNMPNLSRPTVAPQHTNSGANLPDRSFVLSGNERDSIHRQNIDFMSGMTEEEILAEREKLMSMLDPAIVAFLKSKRYHETPPEETRQPSIAQQNIVVEDLKLEDIDTLNDIVTRPEAEKWLNFDTLEKTKLAWMRNVSVPKIEKDGQYEARFDFAGWLLPFVEKEISEKNRVLYHHGDEPGRPGYTLQELFQLCRSSVIQQKIVALNTIACLLELQSSGVYDQIIDLPIEQIFFVVRFCLDENTPATLNASIKAMRNLIYYTIDETCLDGLLGFGIGFVQPILAIDNKETEDDKTVNDQQLAESNLVKCLARTDILTRIRYVINTVKPSMETIVYCLEILIRLIRDSDFIVMQVYECPDLVQSVIRHFVPPIYKPCSLASTYGIPLTHAIKFLRVLAARNRKIATALVEKYKVLDSVTTYLSNEFVSTNSKGLKLQIESLNLWATLLQYGIGVDYFKVLQPILIRLLDYHLGCTDATTESTFVIQAHASAFLHLVAIAMRHDYVATLIYTKMIVDRGLGKWCVQFGGITEFSCGKLQLISSLMSYLSSAVKYQPNNLNIPQENMCRQILTLVESTGFMNVTKSLRNGSNVLNNYETHKCSANFKYTEAAVWNASDHVVPVIQTTSCLPFLSTLSDFVLNCSNIQLKKSFITQLNIAEYLTQLQTAKKYHLTSNWYTKVESNIIMNVVKLSVQIQNNIDTGKYYDIAVKTLSIFNSEQKADIELILKDAVFCTKFYPSEVFLKDLNLNGGNDEVLKNCLGNITSIFEVYINCLGLRNTVNFNDALCTDLNLGNVMPIDWIFTPIVALYSNQADFNEAQQIHVVTNCLRWVYIYETYFPNLSILISPTDRFCRLACTFLGSDSLFLNPDIHHLLKLSLKNILSLNEPQINFDKTIEGLNNFQDFYTQLLEQFQGVSYGDKLFSLFILVPLAQRHSVKLRKTLWSEYAGIVQVFCLTADEVTEFCPIELFLEPAETDLSLLQCYRRGVMSGMVRKVSVLCRIAEYHCKKYVERIRNKK